MHSRRWSKQLLLLVLINAGSIVSNDSETADSVHTRGDNRDSCSRVKSKHSLSLYGRAHKEVERAAPSSAL